MCTLSSWTDETIGMYFMINDGNWQLCSAKISWGDTISSSYNTCNSILNILNLKRLRNWFLVTHSSNQSFRKMSIDNTWWVKKYQLLPSILFLRNSYYQTLTTKDSDVIKIIKHTLLAAVQKWFFKVKQDLLINVNSW